MSKQIAFQAMQAGAESRSTLLDFEKPPVLVIGVTGHRDLRVDDTDPLTDKVRIKLQFLREKFAEARLIILSSLAEGADQLVAGVAVDLGMELIVPLPFPSEIFREEFNRQSDRECFDRLLAKATACFVVPIVKDVACESRAAQAPDPNLAYAALGRLIACSSDILLALWDGQPSDKIGGTAHVVRYMRTGHGLPEPLADLGSLVDSPEHAIIYHLVTPRQSYAMLENPLEWRTPLLVGGSQSEADAFKEMRSLLAKMDRRKDKRWLNSKTGRATFARSTVDLDVPKELLNRPEISSLIQRYAEADALALRFQTSTRQTFNAIFGFAMLSAIFVSAYWNWGDPGLLTTDRGSWWHLPEKHHPLVVWHAVLLAAAFVVYAWFRRWPIGTHDPNRHHKHLDYRVLAEALRVQIYWRLSGLMDSVSEKYLRRHRSALDWVKSVLRLAYLDACIDGPPTSPPQINAVIHGWIFGQAMYQRNTRLVRDERRLLRLEWVSQSCFGGGILIMLFECLHRAQPSFHRNALIFFAGLLPVLAGLFEFYLRVQGYKDHTHEARKTATIFLNAYRSLWYLQPGCADSTFATTHDAFPVVSIPAEDRQAVCIAQRILREAGTEALEENCDWFLMHRSREIVVPG